MRFKSRRAERPEGRQCRPFHADVLCRLVYRGLCWRQHHAVLARPLTPLPLGRRKPRVRRWRHARVNNSAADFPAPSPSCLSYFRHPRRRPSEHARTRGVAARSGRGRASTRPTSTRPRGWERGEALASPSPRLASRQSLSGLRPIHVANPAVVQTFDWRSETIA